MLAKYINEDEIESADGINKIVVLKNGKRWVVANPTEEILKTENSYSSVTGEYKPFKELVIIGKKNENSERRIKYGETENSITIEYTVE